MKLIYLKDLHFELIVSFFEIIRNRHLGRFICSFKYVLLKTKTNVNFEQPIEAVTHNQTPSKEKEIENIEAKNELISNLGLELEGFYKQLQGRLKSQYDLENWKKKRSQMALKRLGLQTTTITEGETSITGPDDKVFETFEVKNVEENKSKKKSEINEICSENDTTKSSIDEGVEKKDASKIKIVKKCLNFDGTNDENEVIESSKEIISNDTPKMTKSDTGQEDFFDSNILGVPKDPDSDFLSMILPLKGELIPPVSYTHLTLPTNREV